MRSLKEHEAGRFSMDEGLKKAIEAAGGKAISITDAAKKSATGKDHIIIK